MARSQVQGQTKESASQVSMTRTSKTGWIQDSFHPAIAKMSERVTRITGLRTNTFYDEAELLQVQRSQLRHKQYRHKFNKTKTIFLAKLRVLHSKNQLNAKMTLISQNLCYQFCFMPFTAVHSCSGVGEKTKPYSLVLGSYL